MKRNERKLLILAGILFAAVLVVRVGPMLVDRYRNGQEEAALLRERIERYEELAREAEDWNARLVEMQARVAELDGWVFPGSNPNLISSSVQRELRRAMDATGVTLREMGVARYVRRDGWLMVHQDMSFLIDQGDILEFLSLLEQARPRLFVTEFSITKSRNEFFGTITVTGFSRDS